MSESKLAEVIEDASSHITYGAGEPAYVRGDLERITASIKEAFILIPRDELPSVPANAFNHSSVSVGPWCFSGAHDKDPAKIRVQLVAMAAWADYLERRQADLERLQTRRDELAVEFGSSPLGYKDTFDSTQRAIDRIIELEAARDRP